MAENSILLKEFTLDDIPFGMRLKSMAGWNQMASDWELLLRYSKGGSYVAYYNQQQAGTITSIQYQDKFSWIGMALVEPGMRGMGIGTKLLNAAIQFAEPLGPVLLDATPMGRKLYKTLGFADMYALKRLEIPKAPSFKNTEEVASIKRLNKQLLQQCIRYDTDKFGAERGDLLHTFHLLAPEYGFIALREHKIAGYCLGRHGSRFEQIGPLVANNFSIARALFEKAVSQCQNKPAIVDVLLSQSQWYQYLLEIGFREQRPFIRMRLGKWGIEAELEAQFAMAGPEFG